MDRRILTAFCAGIALFVASCKKDKAPAPPDYQPMTEGSTWTYQPSQGTAYTLTVTNRDTTALGRTFKVFANSNGGNRYRYKSGNEYYQLTVIPTIAPNGFAELYLKDNQPVNSTWSTSLPVTIPALPLPLTANLNYTIKTRDTSMTVNNRTFNGVIRVRLDVSVTSFGSLGGGDFYYADKVGLIESRFQLNLQGQQGGGNEILTAYTIR